MILMSAYFKAPAKTTLAVFEHYSHASVSLPKSKD